MSSQLDRGPDGAVIRWQQGHLLADLMTDLGLPGLTTEPVLEAAPDPGLAIFGTPAEGPSWRWTADCQAMEVVQPGLGLRALVRRSGDEPSSSVPWGEIQDRAVDLTQILETGRGACARFVRPQAQDGAQLRLEAIDAGALGVTLEDHQGDIILTIDFTATSPDQPPVPLGSCTLPPRVGGGRWRVEVPAGFAGRITLLESTAYFQRFLGCAEWREGQLVRVVPHEEWLKTAAACEPLEQGPSRLLPESLHPWLTAWPGRAQERLVALLRDGARSLALGWSEAALALRRSPRSFFCRAVLAAATGQQPGEHDVTDLDQALATLHPDLPGLLPQLGVKTQRWLLARLDAEGHALAAIRWLGVAATPAALEAALPLVPLRERISRLVDQFRPETGPDRRVQLLVAGLANAESLPSRPAELESGASKLEELLARELSAAPDPEGPAPYSRVAHAQWEAALVRMVAWRHECLALVNELAFRLDPAPGPDPSAVIDPLALEGALEALRVPRLEPWSVAADPTVQELFAQRLAFLRDRDADEPRSSLRLRARQVLGDRIAPEQERLVRLLTDVRQYQQQAARFPRLALRCSVSGQSGPVERLRSLQALLRLVARHQGHETAWPTVSVLGRDRALLRELLQDPRDPRLGQAWDLHLALSDQLAPLVYAPAWDPAAPPPHSPLDPGPEELTRWWECLLALDRVLTAQVRALRRFERERDTALEYFGQMTVGAGDPRLIGPREFQRLIASRQSIDPQHPEVDPHD